MLHFSIDRLESRLCLLSSINLSYLFFYLRILGKNINTLLANKCENKTILALTGEKIADCILLLSSIVQPSILPEKNIALLL